MKIGIDVSQIVYKTGVSNYLRNLIEEMIKLGGKNEYVLFFSSLRQGFPKFNFSDHSNVKVKKFKIPPSLLDILWNRLHVLPIESLIGAVDIFITSDWTQPPVRKAKKATIIYDLIVYKYPQETHSRIVNTQKRKLGWVAKESDLIFTISQSSKKDIVDILNIDSDKIKVIYPGF